MTAARWDKGRVRPDRVSGRKPGRTEAIVSSRADWRGLIALAVECVADAEAVEAGGLGSDAELRLMSLFRRASPASSAVLDRDAGASVADVGRAFLRLLAAFARRETPAAMRLAMIPTVAATAAFLDDQLHQLNAAEFERAHHGRPEVYG